MKYLLLILVLLSHTFAFEVSIKSGKTNSQSYSILNLSSSQIAFECNENLNEFMKIISIECDVERGFVDDIDDIKHPLINLSFDKQRDSFKLIVTSSVNMKLYATSKPFYEEKVLNYFEKHRSHNWSIIIFDKELPFLTSLNQSGLNFPIPRDFETLPSVGPVDINSLPVSKATTLDVEYYVKLEKTFGKEDYEESLRIARELIQKYPNSIFYSDFLRYEMKSLQMLGMEENFDDIARIGKNFIRNYTSDEYLAEVLLIMAKTYSATGFLSDANYFFDRLINEHKNTYFGDLGRIAFGLHRYKNDDQQGGIDTILDTFYNTKHLKVATVAADELAQIYLDSQPNEAVKYLQTIWDNNKEFLLHDREKLHSYANKISNHEQGWQLALKMYEALGKLYDRNIHDEFSEVIYKIALMNDKLKNYEDAYENYEFYVNNFAYGEYAPDAYEALDMLLIKQDSQNIDEKLTKLDALIEKNPKENIGKEAIVAKLKVLNGEGMFVDSIQMYPQVQKLEQKYLEEANKYLNSAFEQHIVTLLNSQSCNEIDILIRQYELDLNYEQYDNKKLFDCYFEVARYESAKAIVNKNIEDEDIDERVYWMCQLAKVNMKQREYAIAKDIYNDIFALNKQDLCKDIYLNLFATQKHSNDVNAMIKSVQEIEKKESNVKLLQLYKDIIEAAQDKDIKKIYVKKLLDKQKELNLLLYSPWIELQAATHMQSSQELINDLNASLNIANNEQKARIYFEIGNSSVDLNNAQEAIDAYEKCMNIDSMWKSLCEDAISLIQE